MILDIKEVNTKSSNNKNKDIKETIKKTLKNELLIWGLVGNRTLSISDFDSARALIILFIYISNNFKNYIEKNKAMEQVSIIFIKI